MGAAKMNGACRANYALSDERARRPRPPRRRRARGSARAHARARDQRAGSRAAARRVRSRGADRRGLRARPVRPERLPGGDRARHARPDHPRGVRPAGGPAAARGRRRRPLSRVTRPPHDRPTRDPDVRRVAAADDGARPNRMTGAATAEAATEYDWLVVGSGFGGSVSALRLAEKGYRVAVLECGRRFADEDFAETTWQMSRYYWMPKLGLKGILRLSLFRDIFIASGCGVGGGSLGYANTLYQPKPESMFYRDPQWAGMADWYETLAPHYREAERMLGVTTYEGEGPADALLRELGEELGV